MNRILPVTARLRGKWLGNAEVYKCASEIVELAPATTREHPAAISLPFEFDRVLALQEETTAEMVHERLRPGERHHGPTTGYRLDNVVLSQGTLYYKGGYDVIRRGSSAIVPRHREHFPVMQLCTSYVIERYFGHWLNDGLALELLADELSLKSLVLKRTPWLHEPDYRKLSGLEAVQAEHALIDHLWVVDDRGINSSWIARIGKLRERFRSALTCKRAKRVMLGRGALGAPRNLVNTNEVQEALQKIGFEIVNPESESAGDIVSVLSSAEIVVLVEGSAQSHCTYALPIGSTLLTIQPPNRFGALSKERADAVGFNWAFVVADPRREGGFYLPIDRLMRTLDEILRVTKRSSVV
jgi:capsular polysaccharide biosynthesis protein